MTKKTTRTTPSEQRARGLACGLALLLTALAPASADPLADARKAIERGISKHKLKAPFAAFKRSLGQLDAVFLEQRSHPQLRKAARLPGILRHTRRDPLALGERTYKLALKQRSGTLAERLITLAAAVDCKPPADAAEPPAPPAAGSALAAHLTYIEGRLDEARKLRNAAFAKLPEGQQRFLHLRGLELLQVARQTPHIADVSRRNPDRLRELLGAVALIERVDRAALLQSALALAPLSDPAYLDQLARDLAETPADPGAKLEGARGELLASRQTSAGLLVVGGKGPNHYLGGAALILDIGGDDTYGPGCASVVIDRANPLKAALPKGISVVLDCAGDDRYQTASAVVSQGGAVLGVALLVDRAGADRYEAGQLAQGSGLYGIGILDDQAGDDVYRADSFSQGCGAFGLGLMLDRAGNDKLTAGHFSAGVGLTMGVGGLVDLAGDDVRDVSGQHSKPPKPSTYGTEGRFHGMCLGVGFGLRSVSGKLLTFAPGGVGLVVDVAGNDVVKAGEFGVGCGYHYGLGCYVDLAGDDRYETTRYGVGVGVHQAMGCFIDADGKDHYASPQGPHCGCAWDMGVGAFFELAGDDTYRSTSNLIHGTAMITSLGVFYEAGGKDDYQGKQAPGSGGHKDDAQRKTRSIGLFLDRGGDEDVYGYPASAGAGNGVAKPRTQLQGDATTGHGLFLDE